MHYLSYIRQKWSFYVQKRQRATSKQTKALGSKAQTQTVRPHATLIELLLLWETAWNFILCLPPTVSNVLTGTKR